MRRVRRALGCEKSMKADGLAGVNVIVVEPNAELRGTICEGLRTYGLADARPATSLAALKKEVTNTIVDLVVCDMDHDTEGVTKFIRSIRHGKLGMNPYLVAVATTSIPTESRFRTIIDAGVDAVVIKPLSVSSITDRINFLARQRKSFVVSAHYIGPDRRLAPRPEQTLPLLEVPNTLKERLAGTYDEKRIRAAIEDANASVNKQRTTHNATLIKQIIDQIVRYFESQEINEGVVIHLNHLVRAARDSAERTTGGLDEHVSDLYNALIPVAQKLLKTYLNPDAKDISLLSDVGTAIFMAFGSDEKTRRMSKQIAKSISSAKRFAQVEVD